MIKLIQPHIIKVYDTMSQIDQQRYIIKAVSIGRASSNDTECWYRMNWYIIGKSHVMNTLHGQNGHAQRQRVRHDMWKIIQKRYPEFRKYKIPQDIRGNSPCKLKLLYKIKKFLNNLI